MPANIEVCPLVRPCPGDEKKTLDCGEGVLVEDIVKALTEALGTKVNLVKELESGSGIYTVLHNKETAPHQAFVKGVHSLSALPASIQVKGNTMPSTLSKDEALAIQADTMEHYTNELVVLQLKNLQQKYIDEWEDLAELDPATTRAYMQNLRGILQPVQAKFFSKHGFQANQKGMALMQGIFNREYGDDEEIQSNVAKINAVVGTDFGWLPVEMQARMVAQATPAPTKGTAGKEDVAPTAAAPAKSEADIQATEVQE